MIRFESPTPWALLGALTSAFALFAALYLQISKDWFPCPLCIVQRYGFVLSFAGFLGFLICEKFGFELVDSGDFYFLFM